MTFDFGETSLSISWIMLITLFIIFLILFKMVTTRLTRLKIRRSADEERPMSATEMAHIKSPSIVPVVQLEGPILASAGGQPPLGSVTYADAFARRLDILKNATAVKALIVEGKTPGGSVSGSEIIRTAIADFAEVKPVFFYVSEMAASGGMWALSALHVNKYPDRVFASRGALLGSIGVVGPTIMDYTGIRRISGLLGSGIEAETISGEVLSAGPGKAFGHPFADNADHEWAKERFKSLLEETRQAFIEMICEARQVNESLFSKEHIGAGVVTAEQAVKYGLIDGLLSRNELEEKVRAAVELAEDELLLFLPVSKKTGGRIKRFMEAVPSALHLLSPDREEAAVRAALQRERVLVLDQAHLFGI